MSTGFAGGSAVGSVSASAGVPFDLRVAAQDDYGNIATSYLGTVHFTSSDPSAELPADYSFKAADQGARLFKVVLKTPGQQTITVTDKTSGTLTGHWIVAVL